MPPTEIPHATCANGITRTSCIPGTRLRALLRDRTIVAGGEGIYVIDPEGRRYIDGPGGMWCMQIGYGRKEMADAMAEQAVRLTYASPWFFATEPSAVLARKLAELAPGDLDQVFFTTGGSTAVDSAIRFTHFYHNVLGLPEKKLILSRERSYHGSTFLAASVTGKERELSRLDTDGGRVRFLPDVNPRLRAQGESVEDWCRRKAQDLEDAIQSVGPDRVGAFIAEPVQASGGVVIPPEGYLRATLEICRRHGVLFISDEVVTGFGRLGHWFASDDVFGIQPRHPRMCQGADIRIRASRRDGAFLAPRKAAGRSGGWGGLVHERLHLFRPPGLLRRRSEEHRDHRARGYSGARPGGCPGIPGAVAGASAPRDRQGRARYRPAGGRGRVRSPRNWRKRTVWRSTANSARAWTRLARRAASLSGRL